MVGDELSPLHRNQLPEIRQIPPDRGICLRKATDDSQGTVQPFGTMAAFKIEIDKEAAVEN
jgi:hypothetical protein